MREEISSQHKLASAIELMLETEKSIFHLKKQLIDLKSKISSLKQKTFSNEISTKLEKYHQRYQSLAKDLTKTQISLNTTKETITNLRAGILAEMPQIYTDNGLKSDPTSMFSALPILLFPVRLETRYKTVEGNPELWIRIYPDEIAIHTHELQLTEEEFDDGVQYVRQLWFAGRYNDFDDADSKETKEARKKGAWSEFVNKHDSERAEWIVWKFLNNPDQTQRYATNFGSLPADMTSVNEYGEPTIEITNPPTFKSKTEIEFKPESWCEPARSFIMPDVFIIRLYRNNELVGQKQGNLIEHPLHFGPTPDPDLVDNEIPFFDDQSKWVIDFEEAVSKGMAIKITEGDVENLEEGFSRIIAIGLKLTTDWMANKQYIEQLFENHRYTNGLGFVKQGTPTNNVAGVEESAYSRQDDPDVSWELLNSDNLASEENESAGFRLARALGLRSSIFDNTENSLIDEDLPARHMIDALWPITLGYYMDIMLNKDQFHPWWTLSTEGENFADNDLKRGLKEHFRHFVRGRGPYSALRVGDNTYGILPISSLRSWINHSVDQNRIEEDQSHDERVNAFLPIALRMLYPHWQEIAENPEKVPRISGSTDPGAETLRILAMNASSRNVLIRPFVDLFYVWNTYNIFYGWYFGWGANFILNALNIADDYEGVKAWWDEFTVQRDKYRKSIQKLHLDNPLFPDLNPILLNLVAWDHGYELWNLRRDLVPPEGEEQPSLTPFIQAEPLSETDRVTDDYINTYICGKDAEVLANNVEADEAPDTLLYNLLRIVKIKERENHPSDSFDYLKILPSAELERLLGETLDLYTNRLDAMITSLPTKRLYNMRNIVSEGILIGAYGWVENLQKNHQGQNTNGGYIFAPSHAQAAAGAILRNAYLSYDEEEKKESMSIRLTSDRVRKALWILDGIRQGQSLSALLGYRFEKGILENYSDSIPTLPTTIYELRRLYHLDLTGDHPDDIEIDTDTNDTEEVIAPNNVVDGIKLLTAWKAFQDNDEGAIDFNGNNKLPNRNTAGFKAIARELDCLSDTYDALGDLGLYENIYHNVRGNFDRAPVLLDVIAGSGGTISKPESVYTPMSAFTFQQRVLVVLDDNIDDFNIVMGVWNPNAFTTWLNDMVTYLNDDPPDPPTQSPNKQMSTPIVMEPWLNHWLAQMLGPISGVKCRYEFEGLPDPNNNYVTLDELVSTQCITPIDILRMSTSPLIGESTELEQRILVFIKDKHNLSDEEDVHIKFNVTSDWLNWNLTQDRSFYEFLPLAKQLLELITTSRPLEPSDLYRPEEAESNQEAVYSGDDYDKLNQRISDVISTVDILLTILDPANSDNLTPEISRKVLFSTSSLGIRNTIPLSVSDLDILKNQCSEVYKELDRRKTEFNIHIQKAGEYKRKYDESAGHSSDLDPSKIRPAINALINAVKTLFGKSFVVLPYFESKNESVLQNAFNQLGSVSTMNEWFHKTAPTHKGMKKLENILILSKALATGMEYKFQVGQLPQREDNWWLAQPIPADDDFVKPEHGSLSLIVYAPTNPFTAPPSHRLGFIIDEWTEEIPNTTINAAITYHFNRPNTEAPQALLLVVPPVFFDKQRLATISTSRGLLRTETNPAESHSSDDNTSSGSHIWNWQYIAEAVEDALDLAKVRAVDFDAMAESPLGQFLPSLFVPVNLEGGDD